MTKPERMSAGTSTTRRQSQMNDISSKSAAPHPLATVSYTRSSIAAANKVKKGPDHQMIIAIDGPAASGKTSIATMLSKRLGFHLLDTGAMYRAVAYQCHEIGVPYDDEEMVGHIANVSDVAFHDVNGAHRIFINDVDVTDEIRTPEMDKGSSMVSALPAVRQAMTAQQRRILSGNGDWVAEGRDIGTVVCPSADIKVFVTASNRERAIRRIVQRNKDMLSDEIPEQVLTAEIEKIEERDKRDSERDVAPLKAADDAIVMDTTDMMFDSVYDEIVATIAEKRTSNFDDSGCCCDNWRIDD